MTPAIRYRWQGKSDPDDNSGEATYHINGKQHGDSLHLLHFTQAEHIYEMLQDAYQIGYEDGQAGITQQIESVLMTGRAKGKL